jgi:proteasome lid subunit RPN8/RPN11
MYDEIIEFVDLFEHNYIAIPLEISDKYMIKSEENFKKVEINKENDKVIDKDQVNKQIKYLKNKENVVSCIHSTTGKTCIKMAIDLKPESIYLIGMDENYSFGNIKSSTTMKTDIVDTKNDYFFPNYIKENEIISWAPSFMRVKEINNVIDKSDIKIFNLSEESHLNGLKSLSWEEFLKKYI